MAARVLYAPRNISGQATEYAAAVRPHGFHGEVWSYGPTAFGFDADLIVDPDRLLADAKYRWELFDRAVRRFDIFHFQYSRSLLPPEGLVLPELWDLPLLKSLGKRVIMNFRGSDVRLPSAHIEREPDSYLRGAAAPVDEARIRGRIAICRRYCDAMLVSTPGLLDDVPDAIWLPHVIDVSAWERSSREEPEVPVVMHIPSSRTTKASDVIDASMRTLDHEGAIEYRPLRGLDRTDLRLALQESDLVLDSLAIGDHGLISVEAMAAGAIPIAHISRANRERNPGVPVVEATVHDVGEVVAELAASQRRRRELREACGTFVRQRHDRRSIGSELAELYRSPPRTLERSHPDWPRSENRERVIDLEARIDALETEVDPIARGFGRLTASLPQRVTDRLLVRIAELEAELQRADPGSPALRPRGRRRRSTQGTGLRERLKRNPQLHRFARSLRRRTIRWRRR